ncbi:hypothetical protein EDC04DRAFT_2618707 [Pisolithus marmoratus]|nr:hypothetical protein EDC04DRAFT_2618707 [Pisolithus marmoratus]
MKLTVSSSVYNLATVASVGDCRQRIPVPWPLWYCHVDEADTETEKHYIRSTRVRQATPHPTRTVGRRLTVQILSRLWQKGALKQSRMPVIEYDGARRARVWNVNEGNPSHVPDPPDPTTDDMHIRTPELLDDEDSRLQHPRTAFGQIDTTPVPSVLACSIKTPSNDSTVATPPAQLASNAPGVDEPKPSTQLAKAKATFRPPGTKSGW